LDSELDTNVTIESLGLSSHLLLDTKVAVSFKEVADTIDCRKLIHHPGALSFFVKLISFNEVSDTKN